jgi:hypothetical protein
VEYRRHRPLEHPHPAGRPPSIPGPIVASPDPKVNHHPTNSHRRSASGNPVHPRREHHRSARQYQAFPRRPGRPCPAARRPEEECHQEALAQQSRSDRNRRRCRPRSMARNRPRGGCRPVPVAARPKWGCRPAAGRLTKGCHPAGHLTMGSLPAARPKTGCHLAAGRPMWRASHRLAGPTTGHQADWKTVPRSADPRIASADPRTGSHPVRHPREHRSLAGAAHFRSCRRENLARGCRCSSDRPAPAAGFHRSAARRTGSGFRRDFRGCHRRTNRSAPARGTASHGSAPGCLAPPAARVRMSPGSLRRSWATRAKTRVTRARTRATKVRTTVRTRATPEAAASRWTDSPSCSRPALPGRPGIQASRILSASS